MDATKTRGVVTLAVVRVSVPGEAYVYLPTELRQENELWVWHLCDHPAGRSQVTGRTVDEAIRNAKLAYNSDKFMFFLQT